MHKIITQIRDLYLIEEELNSNHSGIFAFVSNEKICQAAATYIYRNKNVYIFINESEEVHFNLKLDSEASFTILKHEQKKLSPKAGFIPSYSLLSITITGTVKNLTEQKLVDDITGSYVLKYGKKSVQEKNEILPGVKILLIDTQEIQAFEEIGG
ncbi:MAG: hypothetical protein ACM34J_07170 [Ignavibacteria bacterium]